MLPTYTPGTVVFGLRWVRPLPGKVVIADLHGREIIKRVADVGVRGYFLLGDNTGSSSDSRKYGWFKPQSIKSVIIGSILR